MIYRRTDLAVGAIALLVVVYVGWASGFVSKAVGDSLVGYTDSQVVGSYGIPNVDERGYRPVGLENRPSLPRGEIRTLTYAPGPRGWLHPEGGVLYVWLVKRDGVWVCFESLWVPEGVKF